jgi:HlyD family type I secretion membrane fusion protein
MSGPDDHKPGAAPKPSVGQMQERLAAQAGSITSPGVEPGPDAPAVPGAAPPIKAEPAAKPAAPATPDAKAGPAPDGAQPAKPAAKPTQPTAAQPAGPAGTPTQPAAAQPAQSAATPTLPEAAYTAEPPAASEAETDGAPQAGTDTQALAAVRAAIIDSRAPKPRRIGSGSEVADAEESTAGPATTRRIRFSRNTQMRFLGQSAMLEEAGTPRLLRAAMLAVSGLVACAIAWAAVTKVDEVAVGPGQILPSSRVQVVQHLEGGIVREILVQDGALVKKGQVLIRLDRAAAMAELDQERAKETILSLQADRLAAFAGGKGWKPLKLTGKLRRYRHLVADQLALLAQQRRERMSQRVVIQSQIRQREAELVVLAKTETSLVRQLAIVRESFQMRRRLLKQGVTSRADYLVIKRDLERTTGELNAIRARGRKARAELRESGQKLEELDQRLRSEALAERGKITAELAQVHEKMKRLQDRVTRLEVRAPARGYVKGLKVNTMGGVIQPGQPIMEIVPVDGKLIVESRITTRDVGHLQIGQRAKIKIDTYDFARYGAVRGTLISISATTFQDDNGRPYYKGIIKLDRVYAGHNPKANPITPGMTVQAEIVTGSKSVLAYLLKPITTTLQSGLRER